MFRIDLIPRGSEVLETQTEVSPAGAIAVTARRRALAITLGSLVIGSTATNDPYGLVPTGPLRWTVTVVCIGVATALWLRRPAPIDRISAWWWAGLLFWLFLTTLLAVDPLHAWIGTPDRRFGFVAWCTLPLVFLCGQAVRERADRTLVLRAGALAASVVGVWCAFELAGFSLIGTSFAHHRLGGPFGQPAYLGAAALLLGPIALAVARDRDGSVCWRGLGVFGAVSAAFALLGSQTRGAWAGAAVAGFVVGVQYVDVVRRQARVLIVAGALLAGLFVATPLGTRAVTESRVDEWRVATRVIADHPVFGVGPEGYRTMVPRYVDAAYVRDYGVDVIPDRAHNGVLDVMAIGGVPAGLAYLGLLVLVVVRAVSAIRRRDPVEVALGAALIAYATQQLFLFPLQELDPVFWVLAGLLFARDPALTRVGVRVPRVGVVVVVVATAAAGVMGLREVGADRALARAADAPGATGLAEADHATRLRPDSIRTWFVAARVAARGDALTDVDVAIDRSGRGLERSPSDPALRKEYARLLAARAQRSGLPADVDRARRVIDAYLVDAPNDPELRAEEP